MINFRVQSDGFRQKILPQPFLITAELEKSMTEAVPRRGCELLSMMFSCLFRMQQPREKQQELCLASKYGVMGVVGLLMHY